MPDFMFNIGELILLIIIPILFFQFRSGGKEKHPMENGLTPIFQEQCGGRFESLYLSAPFVRHALYADFIVFAYANTQIVLPYEDIASATLTRRQFSRVIIYSYKRVGVPLSIIMWSKSPDTVLELLRARHVPVTRLGQYKEHSKQVNLDDGNIRWPHKCVMCGADADKTITTNFSVSGDATRITYPICEKHHIKCRFAAALSKGNMFYLGLGVISIFCLLGYIGFINQVINESSIGQFNGWRFFFFGFPIVYWGLFFWARLNTPVRIRDAKKGEIALEFLNAEFAHEFKAANQVDR